ncbi:hypothetical protein [Cryobacterium sp. MDB2-10]|uniref:hypothetical protein n=1 Tax=Cryobacterium sp. MDB2-10 TaxID=1259177 RepID=UPI0010741C90|nr:hypothetical protein [Cryobacterium sp. MDB2-10]TFC23973.1 hypothetical protein E3O51_00165 [Cryobacterium sp. MDB2-10]
MSRQILTEIPRRSIAVGAFALLAFAGVVFGLFTPRTKDKFAEEVIVRPENELPMAASQRDDASGSDEEILGPENKPPTAPSETDDKSGHAEESLLARVGKMVVIVLVLGIIAVTVYATMVYSFSQPLGIPSLNAVLGTVTLVGLIFQALSELVRGKLQDTFKVAGHGLVIMGGTLLAFSLWGTLGLKWPW